MNYKCGSVASGNFTAKCREICVDMCMRNGVAIGGPGKEVEIDETKIGKKIPQRTSCGWTMDFRWL